VPLKSFALIRFRISWFISAGAINSDLFESVRGQWWVDYVEELCRLGSTDLSETLLEFVIYSGSKGSIAKLVDLGTFDINLDQRSQQEVSGGGTATLPVSQLDPFNSAPTGLFLRGPALFYFWQFTDTT